MADTLWTPSNLTSATVVGWFDAADYNTFTFDPSNKVVEWKSKVGGWKVTQTNASNRPGYSSTGYNNLPAVLFTEDGHHLSATAPASLPVGSEAGVMSGVAAYLRRIGDYTTLYYYGSADGRKARSIAATGEAVSSGYYGNDVIGNVRWTGFDRMFVSAISETGIARQWVDGGVVQQEQKSVLITPTGTIFWVGRSINGDPWKNPVQEIVLLKGTLSDDERDKLFGYYAWRWNLVAQLPTAHPYKNAAPTVASANPAITADLTVTEDSDTLGSHTKVRVTAKSSITEENDTVISRAFSRITVSASVNEDSDTLVSVGKNRVTARLIVTEDDDLLSAGKVQLRVRARATIQEQDDYLQATAKTSIKARLVIVEDDDTLDARIGGSLRAYLNVTEDNDTLTARAKVRVKARANITEQGDRLVATAIVKQAKPVITPRSRNLVLVLGLSRDVSVTAPLSNSSVFTKGVSRASSMPSELSRGLKI